MLGESLLRRSRYSWPWSPVRLLLIGAMLTVAAAAAGETSQEDPDRLAPALMARAQALARLRQNLEVDRLKLGELGVPDLVGGVLSAPVVNGDFATAAINFFRQNQILFGLESPVEDLRVASIDSDELGHTHVRLRQYHDGVRVMYGDLRAHFGNDQVLRVVNGEVLPDILIATVPLISAEAARQRVAAELLVDAGSVSEELVIYEFEKVRYLAWRLLARVASPPGRWEVFVDATSGETIYRANRIQHEGPARRASLTAGSEIGIGTGVMGDHKSHIDSYFDDRIYILDDRTRRADNNIHGHNGSMPDTAAILTYVYVRDLPGVLVDDDDNIWQETWQAPGVDAHVYASWVYDFLNGNVQRNGFDDLGSSMISTVSDGSCQNNAYWNGEQVSYCGVSTGFHPMSGGLDVVAHEWGHAVTEHTSNLVYEKESGALNESFSDMMGVRLLFAHDTPGWRIGRSFNGSGFRDMAFPRSFGDPDCKGGSGWIDVENCGPNPQNDYCGVHTNSGVPNHMFFLLSAGGDGNGRRVTAIGIDSAFRIMYRANRFYWTESSDLEDGKAGSISAALDLDPAGEWAEQVELAWGAVCVGVPANVPPISDPGGPYEGNAGTLIFFDGTGSQDPDGTIARYIWAFGDGNIGSGSTTYHVYQEEGSYPVTLLVIDNANAQANGNTTAEIGPPSAVELASFELVPLPGAVTISWETSFEEDHAGFHLHRRELSDVDFVRISDRLVTSDDPVVRRYEYVDGGVVPGGTYVYRLESIDRTGGSQLFDLGAVTAARQSPGQLALHQNHPNPFNPRTAITFELPVADQVIIGIYDTSGRLARLLHDGRFGAGLHSVEWDGRDDAGRALDSGVYFCHLQVGTKSLTRKIVLVQ